MSPSFRIPSPAEVFGAAKQTGSALVYAATLPPRAAYAATQAAPVYARALLHPDGFIRSIDDAVIALGGLSEIAKSLDKIGDMAVALDRLAELQDELAQLGAMQASRDRIAQLDEPIASLARTTETLPELALAAEALPRLVDQVHNVQNVVIQMDGRIKDLSPAIHGIAEFGVALESEIDDLGDALAPISRIASRLPGGRKRAKEIKAARAEEALEAEQPEKALPAGEE